MELQLTEQKKRRLILFEGIEGWDPVAERLLHMTGDGMLCSMIVIHEDTQQHYEFEYVENSQGEYILEGVDKRLHRVSPRRVEHVAYERVEV